MQIYGAITAVVFDPNAKKLDALDNWCFITLHYITLHYITLHYITFRVQKCI